MSNTCEKCQPTAVNHPQRAFQHFLLVLGIILATLSFAGVGVLRDTVIHLHNTVSEFSKLPNTTNSSSRLPSLASSEPKRCNSPIVYNKPAKTAGTKIQNDIFLWALKVGRKAYKCSGHINQASMQMRECIPQDNSGCAIIATHVIMSPVMTRILEEKIGKFVIVTSTRNPRSRLLSQYFQSRRTQASAVLSNSTDVLKYARNYNPWFLYNYHTGAHRVGRCPLTQKERMLIPDMVNRADVVIDVDLLDVSRTILKVSGLFELTNSKVNVRHSSEFEPSMEIEQAIKNATCVEEEMHRLYRLRMASLYEKATGKSCLSNTRYPTTTCF